MRKSKRRITIRNEMNIGTVKSVMNSVKSRLMSEDMNLTRDTEFVIVRASVGRNDGFDVDDVGVEERSESGGDGAFDVTDLKGLSVEDFDGVGVLWVLRLAD